MTASEDSGKAAWVLSLDDEQIEKIENDDIAVLETDDQLFLVAHNDHEDGLMRAVEDSAEESDTPLRIHEVTRRE